MKRKEILFDLLFYLALPYFIWYFGKDIAGDYFAILLSIAPSFVYTSVRFFITKQFNFTGIFIISTLLVNTLINILSGSAERMLWNEVYFSLVLSAVYLLSIIIKKPLVIYFAADIAALQGINRKQSYTLYRHKGLFIYFQLFTLLFVINCIVGASIKGFLLYEYGIGNYDMILVAQKIKNWTFSGIKIIAYIIILKKINMVYA